MKIFDIGANKGLFTDKCLSLYQNCNVITVEPNPELYKELSLKYKNDTRVTLVDKLVSTNNNELIDFYISNADTISTSSLDWIHKSRFTNNYVWYAPIKVETINLDKLIEIYGEPDLIKVDVEGYEYEVLKGLTKKSGEICFEWSEEEYEKLNKTCEYLKTLNYENYGYIIGDEYLIRPNTFTDWESSDFHNDIVPERKTKWGMIWTY